MYIDYGEGVSSIGVCTELQFNSNTIYFSFLRLNNQL